MSKYQTVKEWVLAYYKKPESEIFGTEIGKASWADIDAGANVDDAVVYALAAHCVDHFTAQQQAELAKVKAERDELLAANKRLKHLADPAREVDILAVCEDVIDQQVNHHSYTNTDYCHFCGVRLCCGEKHRSNCSVLIAMDLMTNAKARGDL